MLRGLLAIAAVIAIGSGIVYGAKQLWFNSETTSEAVQNGSESEPLQVGSTLGKGSQGEQPKYSSWIPTFGGIQSHVSGLLPSQQKSSGNGNGNPGTQENAVPPTSGEDKNQSYLSMAVEHTKSAFGNTMNYLRRKEGANPPSQPEATYCQACRRSLKMEEANGDKEIPTIYSENTERISDSSSPSAVVPSINLTGREKFLDITSSTSGATIRQSTQSLESSGISAELVNAPVDTSLTIREQNSPSYFEDAFSSILLKRKIVVPGSETTNDLASSAVVSSSSVPNTSNSEQQSTYSPEVTHYTNHTLSSIFKMQTNNSHPPSPSSTTSGQTANVLSTPLAEEQVNCADAVLLPKTA